MHCMIVTWYFIIYHRSDVRVNLGSLSSWLLVNVPNTGQATLPDTASDDPLFFALYGTIKINASTSTKYIICLHPSNIVPFIIIRNGLML